MRGIMRKLLLGALTSAAIMIGPSGGAVTLPEDTELDLTLSPAPVGGMVGGQTIVGLPPIAASANSATNVVFECSLKNKGGFVGERSDDGVVSGTFRFLAVSKCDTEMIELDVLAQLEKNGAAKSSTGHSTCSNCLVEKAGPKTHDCDDCNGRWRVRSTHVFTFPLGFVLVDYDQGRCSVPNPAQVICTVLSSKVKL